MLDHLYTIESYNADEELGDFFAEGERRGAEYLWAKTTHEEAAKILPNYKKYIDTPGRWDRDALKDL
ncbi:MAG: hypothetical protein MJZ27_01215 [Bacteroidales bacterium]|nr:hypothetical protein [Bacteroidales bacterium]